MFPGRWDGGSNSAYAIPASPYTPAKVANGNDPCPVGFKVPSRDDWSSIANGIGGSSIALSSKTYNGVNRFVFVAKNDVLTTATHGALLNNVTVQTAGLLIYPAKSGLSGAPSSASDYETDPALFLPAAGFRYGDNGNLSGVSSSYGYYWSSTAYSSASNSYAYGLNFNGSNVYPTSNYTRAYGLSVRCVAE